MVKSIYAQLEEIKVFQIFKACNASIIGFSPEKINGQKNYNVAFSKLLTSENLISSLVEQNQAYSDTQCSNI